MLHVHICAVTLLFPLQLCLQDYVLLQLPAVMFCSYAITWSFYSRLIALQLIVFLPQCCSCVPVLSKERFVWNRAIKSVFD